jgi:hypothetical protein
MMVAKIKSAAMRPRLFVRNSLRAIVRANVEVTFLFDFPILVRFPCSAFALGSRDDGLCLREGAGGFKRRNLLQREYLVALDRDPQTVCSVRPRLDAHDRALEHYDGLRNLSDDDEAFPQLGGPLAQHKEAARAEIFEYRVDAELLAVRREVERERWERAAYARLSALLDRVKVFQ